MTGRRRRRPRGYTRTRVGAARVYTDDGDVVVTTTELRSGHVVNVGGRYSSATVATVEPIPPGAGPTEQDPLTHVVDFEGGGQTFATAGDRWLLVDDRVRDRWTNQRARFLPQIDAGERPAIELASPIGGTVLVFAYIRDGQVRVTVDTEESGDEHHCLTPIRIGVNGIPVWAADHTGTVTIGSATVGTGIVGTVGRGDPGGPDRAPGAGEGDEHVWLPPLDDGADDSQHAPCPWCGSRMFHTRTGRCGSCGRRPTLAHQGAHQDSEP